MTYPDTPGFQKHSATSRAAAEELTSQHSMEDDIYRYLEHYASGFTADELHEALLDKHPGVQAGTDVDVEPRAGAAPEVLVGGAEEVVPALPGPDQHEGIPHAHI